MKEIYYIGGSPCSGKSTIAEMLAAEYGFAYYKLDDHLFPYMEQAAADGKPLSTSQLAMDFEQMWMRIPELQAQEEFGIYEEILPYALRGIGELESGKPIVAEGAGFIPTLLARDNISHNRYICIVPTEDFQCENYSKREWIGEFLSGCKDPDAAFNNWMSRDAVFAKEVLRQAQEYGYRSIVVDGSQSIEENYKIVVRAFELHAQS